MYLWRNKQAKFDFKFPSDRKELIAAIFLVFGFFSTLTTSVLANYILAGCFGLLFGRVYYKTWEKTFFPSFFITIAFLFGLLLGGFRTNHTLLLLVYIISSYSSYYIHKEHLIDST